MDAASRGRTAARGGRWGDARRATCPGVSNARFIFAVAIAVADIFAGCVEGFPRDSGRVINPRLFRLGVAARRLTLFEHSPARLLQACIDLMKLRLAFDLNAEVI